MFLGKFDERAEQRGQILILKGALDSDANITARLGLNICSDGHDFPFVEDGGKFIITLSGKMGWAARFTEHHWSALRGI